MNRWSRIVWTLALLGALAWIVGGSFGYEVRDNASLARHTLLVFAALLALVFTHGWVAVHLLVVERLLRRSSRLSARETSIMASARRRGAAGATLALVSVVAQFAVSNALYPGRLGAGWHALGALGSALVLGLALTLEWAALTAAGKVAKAIAD